MHLVTANSHKNLLLYVVLFIFLTVGMHIVTPTPGGVGLYLTPNIIGWVFFSLVVSIGFWQITVRKKLTYTHFHTLTFVGLLLLFIPLFYGNSFSVHVIPRLLVALAGFALLLSLSQLQLKQYGKSVLLLLLLLGVFVEALIGLLQLYILLPFDINIVGYTPVSGRPYGSFTQPNVMASFLSSGVALALFLFLPGKLSRSKVNLSPLLCWCLFSFSLLITVLQSKTGYLASMLVLLLFVPRIGKHRKNFNKPVIAIILGTLVGVITMNTVGEVHRGTQLYQANARSEMYYVTGKMFVENPIVGVGYGNFEQRYRAFHLDLMKTNDSLTKPAGALRHPHNEVLLWLSEGGLISLIALVLFSYAYLRLFKGLAKDKALPLLALLTPIFLHSQTEFPFYHSFVHWLYFIIFIWLTVESSACNKKNVHITRTRSIQVSIIVSTLFISLFMASTFYTSLQMERFKVSGEKDIAILNTVVNRLAWQEYFEVTLYSYSLKAGFAQKNKDALLQYVVWASDFVKHSPRKELYHNMILAIDTLYLNGIEVDNDIKNTIYREAVMLYPGLGKQTNE